MRTRSSGGMSVFVTFSLCGVGTLPMSKNGDSRHEVAAEAVT